MERVFIKGSDGMDRYRQVVGRSFENQQTEIKIGVAILNKMTELGRPVFEQNA